MPVDSTSITDPAFKLSLAIKQLNEHQGDVREQLHQQIELVQQLSQHSEHLASLTSILETRLNQGLQECSRRITQTALSALENKLQTVLNEALQQLQQTVINLQEFQEQTIRKIQRQSVLTIIACGISMLFASGMTLWFCHDQEQTAKQNVNYLRYGLALKQAWPHLSKSERAKILGQAQADKKTL